LAEIQGEYSGKQEVLRVGSQRGWGAKRLCEEKRAVWKWHIILEIRIGAVESIVRKAYEKRKKQIKGERGVFMHVGKHKPDANE